MQLNSIIKYTFEIFRGVNEGQRKATAQSASVKDNESSCFISTLMMLRCLRVGHLLIQ